MSRKELVMLVSRAFAMLMISWALIDVTYLPERLFILSHHMSQHSVLATENYWSTYYLIITVLNVVRTLALSLAAVLFWRCGPRVEALFSLHPNSRETPGGGGAPAG